MMTTDANGNISSDNAEEAQAMFRQIQGQYSSSNQQQDPPNKKKQDPFDSETFVRKAPRIN